VDVHRVRVRGPAVVEETPPNQHFKPWITFGPRGQIVLVWRTWLGPPATPRGENPRRTESWFARVSYQAFKG
jgi:hypothetical protein